MKIVIDDSGLVKVQTEGREVLVGFVGKSDSGYWTDVHINGCIQASLGAGHPSEEEAAEALVAYLSKTTVLQFIQEFS